MVNTIVAGHQARAALIAARQDGGDYELEPWPQARARRSGAAAAARAVVRLRIVQRMLVGFLDPVEDALFLTFGLRRLGFPATFHIGRELAPAIAPGGFHAWVQCGGTVVSTSLPVHDEYIPVYGSE
jgi:Transglutaminase-like superfamily